MLFRSVVSVVEPQRIRLRVVLVRERLALELDAADQRERSGHDNENTFLHARFVATSGTLAKLKPDWLLEVVARNFPRALVTGRATFAVSSHLR